MSKVINYLNETKSNGTQIDMETNMILNSLTNALDQFLLMKKAEINVVDADTSMNKAKSYPKGKDKKSKNFKKLTILQNKKKTKKEGKPKGECFHCGVKGHWKRNCQDYLALKMEEK